MRALVDIDTDLNAVRHELARVQKMHGALLDERKAALPARDSTILRDFEAGRSVKAIAFDLGATVNAVWHVVHRSGRTAKSRKAPISHLPADQQRAYHKARAMGAGPEVARQMATAVSA